MVLPSVFGFLQGLIVVLKYFRKFCVFVFLACAVVGVANASGRSFRVSRIQVKGLQGLPAATVLNYLPVRVGQTISYSQTSSIISTLYGTGFFETVELDRQGGTLIVKVKERPTIASVNVKGNKSIPEKKLNEVLATAGVKAGQVYNKSVINSIVEGLRQQYFSMGYYAARVMLTAVPASRNRVAVQIDVKEGAVAKIRSIVIAGNHAFKTATLLREMKLSTPTILAFFTKSDNYSQEKLDASIAAISSYYLNRGYLNFAVTAKQVSISADRMSIYITLKVSEGPIYHLSGFQLAGQVAGYKKQLQKLISLKPGEVFSRQKLMDIQTAIYQFLGTKGYAYPQLNPVPKINNIKHTVFMTLNLNPGKKFYVRQIDFIGNNRTSEYVLREQMRQMEDSLYNSASINESKRRLANLPYLTNIYVQQKPVAGKNNELDLKIRTAEQQAGRASLTGGFSDMEGLFFGVSATEPNFMGTGRLVGVNFQRGAFQTTYGVQYNNPFYSKWGVGRGFNFNYTKTRPDRVNLADFTFNTLTANANFSVPVSLYSSLNASAGYSYTNLENTGSAREVADFVKKHGNDFYHGVVGLGWSRGTLDNVLFPTDGSSQSINFTLNAPLTKSSMTFYSVTYNGVWYKPLFKGLALSLGTTLGYGGSIGKNSEFPFYNNFYAGGLGTVAGYARNSLGPRDSTGNPIGGNIQTIGHASLIIPSYFSQKLRFSLGFNVGNVYDNRVRLNQLRYSIGPVVNWLAPVIGQIQIGLAWPILKHKGDDTQVFGFGAGVSI